MNSKDSLLWMNNRINLFEKICKPSIVNQTNKKFKWIILYDEKTPESFLDKKFVALKGPPSEINMDNWSNKKEIEYISDDAGKTPYIIMTRLDNDDALSIHYVEKIQNLFQKQIFSFINADWGILYNRGSFYTLYHPHNQFCSLIQQNKNLKSIYKKTHTTIHEQGAVEHISKGPFWMITLHEKNMATTLKDFRTLYPIKKEEINNYFALNIVS